MARGRGFRDVAVAVALALAMSLSTVLSACGSADAGSGAGLGDGQAVQGGGGFRTGALPLDALGYGDEVVVLSASCNGEAIYLLLEVGTRDASGAEFVAAEALVAVLGMDLGLVGTMPYAPSAEGLSASAILAAPGGGYWLEERAHLLSEGGRGGIGYHDPTGALQAFANANEAFDGMGGTLLAVDGSGMAYVASNSVEDVEDVADGRDVVFLVSQAGEVVGRWEDGLSSFVLAAVLDDGTPVALGLGEPGVKPGAGDMLALGTEGGTVPLGSIGGGHMPTSRAFYPGVGRTVLFEEGFKVMRLSLDTMEAEAIADFNALAEAFDSTPTLLFLYAVSEVEVCGVIQTGWQSEYIVFTIE